jgi:hypothetical protein
MLTAKEWRADQVHDKMDFFETLISIPLILMTCTLFVKNLISVFGHLTVPGMGVLLQAVIIDCSPKPVRKAMQRLIDLDAFSPEDEREVRELIKRFQKKFMMHALISLRTRGVSTNRQIFFLSLSLQFRGLGRNGLMMMAGLGASLNHRTHGRHRLKRLATQVKELRSDMHPSSVHLIRPLVGMFVATHTSSHSLTWTPESFSLTHSVTQQQAAHAKVDGRC